MLSHLHKCRFKGSLICYFPKISSIIVAVNLIRTNKDRVRKSFVLKLIKMEKKTL